MSVTVELYFNHSGSLKEVTNELNGLLGVRFSDYEGNESDQFCRFLSMELSLGECEDLENNRELNFEDFQYSLDIRNPVPDGDLRCIVVHTMATVAFVLMRRMFVSSSMLVYDVQTVLARYLYDENLGVIDTLSGDQVRFPDHLLRIRKIIEEET